MSESAGLKQRKAKGTLPVDVAGADSSNINFENKAKDSQHERTSPSENHKRTKSRARSMLLLAMVLMPMWPFLDVSCPFTRFFPSFVQTWMAEYHCREVPPEEKSLSADLECLNPVITMHGHLSEADVMKVIREHPYSAVLVKGYVTTDQSAELLQKFKAITAKNKYTMINGSYDPHQRLGSLFSKGVSDGHPYKDYRNGLRRHVEADLSGVWNGTSKDLYGAFVPVGEGELHKLLNFTSKKVVPDTSFFAWFSKKTVSTPIHANWPADTLAIQLAGRKQWVVIDPLDMKSILAQQKSTLHASGKGAVQYPNLKVNAYMETKLKIATAEPGDLFYFPTYGTHTVVSDPGLNVMTALRFHNVKKAFKIHPWKTFQAVSFKGVDKLALAARHKLGLDKYANHFDIQKGDVMTAALILRKISPIFDDLQLERLLESPPCPLNETGK